MYDEDNSTSSAYNLLFLLAGIAAMTYALARFAESQNTLNYEHRLTRIVAGSIMFFVNLLHTQKGDVALPDGKKKVFALGPHRTGWEAAVFATKMKGEPPRFFGTTAYDVVPGVHSFMEMFKRIPIIPSPDKHKMKGAANEAALELAYKVIQEEGCVALFPQGNFARIGEDPPRIYTGAAKIALHEKVPLHVIRLDGFRCIENTWLPLFIRNYAYYRAMLSFFSINNIRITMCTEIDFHLRPENAQLSDDEKITEICAQLYAYYRQTKELSTEEIKAIKEQINDNKHHQFWQNKINQEDVKKKLIELKDEEVKLEQSLVRI